MSALARIAQEMRVAEMATGDRAYDRLRSVVTEGGEIRLSDHELVLAISRALWHRQLSTAQVGLSELELRTALSTVHHERREAA